MFDWIKRRPAAEPDLDDPSLACSFCKRPRQHVRTLVAGPGVLVCDACTVLCAAIVEESSEIDEPFPIVIETLASIVQNRETDTSKADLAGQAALQLAGQDAVSLRRIEQSAIFGRRWELALEANDRIDGGRTFYDDVDRTTCLIELGAYEDAQSVVTRLDPATDEERAHASLQQSAVRLRLSSDLDVVALERSLQALDGVDPMLSAGWSGAVRTTRAELLLRLGSPRRAYELLEPDPSADATPRELLVRGDAALALDRRAEAISCFERASHAPVDRVAAEARHRLDRLRSDPYR